MSDDAQYFYSAAQLAGLPGMPKRSGNIPRRMKQLGIEGRPRHGQGGGLEYPFSPLPAETRAALDKRLAEAAAAGRHEGLKIKLQAEVEECGRKARREAGLKASLTLPQADQARLDAKLQILSALDRYRAQSGLTLDVARHEFSRCYNSGEIVVESWVRERVNGVCRNSLYHWHRIIREEGIAALGGAYGNGQVAVHDQHPARRRQVHQGDVHGRIRAARAAGHRRDHRLGR